MTPVPGVTKIALSGSTVLVRAPVVTMPNVVGALRVSAVAQLQAIGLSVQVIHRAGQTNLQQRRNCGVADPAARHRRRTRRARHDPGLRPAAGWLPLTAALTRPGTVPAGPRDGAGSLGAERSWCLAPVTKEDF